jgi:hypothetical protein
MKTSLLASALALALIGPAMAADPPASAPTSPELKAMDARIRALETEAQKLREQAAEALAEASAARAELEKMKAAQAAQPAPAPAPPTTAEQAEAVAAVTAPAGSSGSAGSATGNAFNPAIAVILNGVYAHHSHDPNQYTRAGFPVIADTGPGMQGLSLGESEVSFAANIDDKFYGQFTVSYHDDNGDVGTDIEEAYIDTLALPDGFNLRAGRFYSDIGYLNSHHTHTDFFVDRPLPYQAFLGNQYGDDGVQVRWVAPTDIYLDFGGELFRGENYPAAGANNGGVGARTLFVHSGGDVGDENSWLAGVSMLKTKSTGADDGFSGNGTLYIADGTWKWAPNGNTKDGGVTLRSELFFDRRDGYYTTPNDIPFNPLDPASQPWTGDRRGAYLEAVWRLNRTWDVGYRYDKLWSSNAGPFASDFDPGRHTIEATWRNSEFSYFRLQYSHDDPIRNIVDNAIFLQYDVALGAHGAHKF